MTIFQAWNGLFPKFQSLDIIVWSALALEKGARSTQKVEQQFFKVGNHHKLESIFKGPYLRPEMRRSPIVMQLMKM